MRIIFFDIGNVSSRHASCRHTKRKVESSISIQALSLLVRLQSDRADTRRPFSSIAKIYRGRDDMEHPSTFGRQKAVVAELEPCPKRTQLRINLLHCTSLLTVSLIFSSQVRAVNVISTLLEHYITNRTGWLGRHLTHPGRQRNTTSPQVLRYSC